MSWWEIAIRVIGGIGAFILIVMVIKEFIEWYQDYRWAISRPPAVIEIKRPIEPIEDSIARESKQNRAIAKLQSRVSKIEMQNKVLKEKLERLSNDTTEVKTKTEMSIIFDAVVNELNKDVK